MTILKDLLYDHVPARLIWVFRHMLKYRTPHPHLKNWWMIDTDRIRKEMGFKTKKSVDDCIEKLVEYKYVKKKINIEKGPNRVVIRGGRTRVFRFNPELVREMREAGILT